MFLSDIFDNLVGFFSEVYDSSFKQWKLTLPENVAVQWE